MEKEKESEKEKEKESENVYCLYTNNEQEKLLAMAYSEDQVIEETKFYESGVWFEYDTLHTNCIGNERLYKKKIIFPKEPLIREKYIIDSKNKNSFDL